MSLRMQYVTKPCIGCGQKSTVDLDIEDVARWAGGELIQNVWPDMSGPDRELLISGTHAACWDALFPEEDDQ